MTPDQIMAFARENVEPLPATAVNGARYRVAATLADGTALPCVVIEIAGPVVDRALKRFSETRRLLRVDAEHRATVASFVTRGNRVNSYDLAALQPSPHAIPADRLLALGTEPLLAWTEFTGRMHDGTEYRFGTQHGIEFFEMPEGYEAGAIERITPVPRGEALRRGPILRARPYFTCYV